MGERVHVVNDRCLFVLTDGAVFSGGLEDSLVKEGGGGGVGLSYPARDARWNAALPSAVLGRVACHEGGGLRRARFTSSRSASARATRGQCSATTGGARG
eukprot:9484947-Pyramimonas_sp.AAC.1